MNKSQILAELPKLDAEERDQVFRKLCELQENDLFHGQAPTEQEKRLLDQTLDEIAHDGDPGKPWREVLCQSSPGG